MDNVAIYTILTGGKHHSYTVAKTITTLGYPNFNVPHMKDHEGLQTAMNKLSDAVSSIISDILSHMGDS